MSGFGNFLAGAVGGGGLAVANMASKYIDEEIQQRRAQALADIQHQTMVRGEEYMQSPEVQGRRQSNERDALQMRSEQALSADVARAESPNLRKAKIDERVSFLQGTTPAEIEAQNAITEGTASTKLDADRTRRLVTDPMDVEKERALAAIRGNEQIRVSEATQEAMQRRQEALKTAFDKLPEQKKLDFQAAAAEMKEVNKAIIEAQAGGGWDPSKNGGQKQLAVTKAALSERMRTILGGRHSDDALGIFSPNSQSAPAPSSPPPAPAPAPKPASSSVVEQRRAEREQAPAGSPQAKWEEKQAAARAAAEAKAAAKQSEVSNARTAFDADTKALDPMALLQKYGDPSSRASLDITRLARLNQIERSIR